MTQQQNTLDTPWILVIVFSVVIAAQSMFIWMRLYRGRGTRTGGRPLTEYYELSRSTPRHEPHQQVAARRTGYSPAVPPPALGRRW